MALTAILLTTLLTTHAQTIRRATTGGAGDGSGDSWANAMTFKAALSASTTEGDQIWVAAGTYTPHASDQTVLFRIPVGVTVYGGFAGTETTFDPATNDTRPRDGNGVLTSVTFLSGDLDGDDGTPPAADATPDQITAYNDRRDDNSHSVVAILGINATLDGLTITNGVNGGAARIAAGLYSIYAGTTLIDCTFSNNTATNAGGGAYFEGVATLTTTTFSKNTATAANGAGPSSPQQPSKAASSPAPPTPPPEHSSPPHKTAPGLLHRCRRPHWLLIQLQRCKCPRRRGQFNATATLIRCTFDGNRTNFTNGGGAYFLEPATLTSCSFTANSSSFGAATYFTKKATLTNCLYATNTAPSSSGAIRLLSGGTITNSTFYANTANSGNGTAVAVSFRGTDPAHFILRNSIFMSNTASASGNQIYVDNTDSGTNSGTQDVTLDHNLIAGGADPRGMDQGVVYAACNRTTQQTNTIDESDPGTVFASTTPTDPDDYLRLKADGPAVNAGNNTYLNNDTPDDDDLRIDLAGVARKQGGTVDLGAYESPFKGTQTTDFTLPTAGVVGAEVPLTATATSGLPVTYASSAPTVAAVMDDGAGGFVLQILTTGTATITASQSGDATYEAAPDVEQTITVRNVSIFRVTTAGTTAGTGTWASPMDLQTALAVASQPGDQVWIKTGEYKPVAIATDATPSDEQRDISFRIEPGLAVYGGFAGTEPDSFDPASTPRTGGYHPFWRFKGQ